MDRRAAVWRAVPHLGLAGMLNVIPGRTGRRPHSLQKGLRRKKALQRVIHTGYSTIHRFGGTPPQLRTFWVLAASWRVRRRSANETKGVRACSEANFTHRFQAGNQRKIDEQQQEECRTSKHFSFLYPHSSAHVQSFIEPPPAWSVPLPR